MTYFKTIIPFLVAALTSILSTPVPARPTTLRDLALSMISLVTLVSERTINPLQFYKSIDFDNNRNFRNLKIDFSYL